ncbi:MAG TPA: PilZ domain-containing protein [Terriglobales bacterium]|nr:PilZ domain-containing protein [Terriglobales bacterium]
MQVETCENRASSQHNSERRHQRFFLSAPIIARRPLDSGLQVTRGITLEISLGGLSAVLCGPPPVGERVSVRLKLMNSAFEAPAIVRHSSAARTGFEFVNLSPGSRRRIENCIQRSLLCPWPKENGLQVM